MVMLMYVRFGIFLFILCVATATAVRADQPEVVCPAATGEVTLDGRPDEHAWANAPMVGPFETIAVPGEPAHDHTVARVLHDGDSLLLAVECSAAESEELARLPRDDDRIWRRERIELFVDPTPDTEDYYHLVLDRVGSRFAVWHAPDEAEGRTVTWEREWEVATAPVADGWAAEIRLPFAALGVEAPAPGTLWRLKIGRDGGRDGPIMWPPNPTRSFHTREMDGALYFDTANLLRNGDFEEGELGEGAPDPWVVHLTSAEVNNAPQGEVRTIEGGLPPGNRAMWFKKLATAKWWPQVWNSGYRLDPGGTYEFSIMVRGTMPQVNVRATAYVEDERVKMSEGRHPDPDEFRRVGFSFVVPEGADEVAVGLSAPEGAGGEVIYDDAVLRRILYAPDAVMRKYVKTDWSPDPDPVHGLEALCERAGHKPWDLFWRGDHLRTHRTIFHDREHGTELWLLDDSPAREYVVTASIWPGWNADCSVLMLPGARMAGDEWRKSWQCNADFSRLTPMPLDGMPLWDLEDPDLYYVHSTGKVQRANLRTGEVTELAAWEPREDYQEVVQERSYGLTKDNEAVFVVDYDGGEWIPYTPADELLPYVQVLDCYGPNPDAPGRLPSGLVATETDSGPKLRVVIGRLVDTDTGEVQRIIAPISGREEYLRTFAGGRVRFPDHASPPDTTDIDELFELYHLLPSCSHGHLSYSPGSEYTCWDGTPRFYRTRDGTDRHQVTISSSGWCYHTCWFHDPRFFVTGVRPYRRDYDRPDNANLLCQVFTDGTWQPVADMKTRFNAYYYGGNFATLSRDATKIHYESSMTGVPKNYIAVAARPQPPRELSWQARDDAVVLRWTRPPHHREIRGYLIYRSDHSGDGYELLTPEPVEGTTWTDATAEPGRAYYYVATSIEHCGLESGYSNEAARAGLDLPDDLDAPLVVYVEAERGLVDLPSGAKPGISRGRDRLGASDWYYAYRTPSAEEGSVAIPVLVPADASYHVWLRVRSDPRRPGDWRLSVDGGPELVARATDAQWRWARAEGSPVSLSAGRHEMALATSSADAQADLLCLATDPEFEPEGPRPEDQRPPVPPSGVAADNVRERANRVTWERVAAPDLSHYNVYASAEAVTEADQRLLIGSPTYEEFVDWGLHADTTYHYAVTAVDRRGNESALSEGASAATPPRAHPRFERELAFDEAAREGPFELAEAPGTHAEQYVILPEDAGDEVGNATVTWEIEVPHQGDYYLWLRYLPRGEAGSRAAAVRQSLNVLLDGEWVANVGGGDTDLSVPESLLQSEAGQREPGDIRNDFWTWARPVGNDLNAVALPEGTHTLTLDRLTPEIRYDTLLVTDEPSYLPPDGRLRQR